MNKEKQPPSTMTIKFCPVCGRTDDVAFLSPKHFAKGKICDGVPRKWVYRRIVEK